jgi:hypothetical protein
MAKSIALPVAAPNFSLMGRVAARWKALLKGYPTIWVGQWGCCIGKKTAAEVAILANEHKGTSYWLCCCSSSAARKRAFHGHSMQAVLLVPAQAAPTCGSPDARQCSKHPSQRYRGAAAQQQGQELSSTRDPPTRPCHRGIPFSPCRQRGQPCLTAAGHAA